MLLFSFGLIGDTQYVDSEDGATFDGLTVRRYRQSLNILKDANTYFNDLAKINNIICNILLGDVIDERSKHLNISAQCLEDILKIANPSLIANDNNTQWHFIVGNHDIASLDRTSIYKSFIPNEFQGITSPNILYYHFSPFKGFRFIILDGYDISTIGSASKDGNDEANSLLALKNPNLSIPNSDWCAGLDDANVRYVPYNGSVGKQQILWLQQTLAISIVDKEICVIFSHMPCYQESCRPSGIMWNCEEILEILHNSNANIACFIAGHDHQGGYSKDNRGIHHITLPSPLECNVGQTAFGMMEIHQVNSNGIEKDNNEVVDNNDIEIEFKLNWQGKSPLTQNEGSHWPPQFILKSAK
jgi:manganese-dependent ADP-ribose/CDP-alcohol diphosphatase